MLITLHTEITLYILFLDRTRDLAKKRKIVRLRWHLFPLSVIKTSELSKVYLYISTAIKLYN